MSLKKKIIILAEGGFDILEAKTAVGVIRYNYNYDIIAIIDSVNCGKDCSEIIGIGKGIPIVKSLEDALLISNNIEYFLLGTAPRGGPLNPSWREIIINAMKNKLNIMNPLHKMFNEDEEFKKIANENNVFMWDLRKVNLNKRVGDLSSHKVNATVIFTAGTDCNVGKMTTSVELNYTLNNKGYNSVFVPTGQTGILVGGWGTAIDETIVDFTSGAMEDLVLEASKKASSKEDFIIVEGQASLIHPGYSGLALSMLHGVGADAIILCHQSTRKNIRRYDIPVPPLNEYIYLHKILTKYTKDSPVIAISLNTFGLTDEEAIEDIKKIGEETGLPVTDPIRYGSDILIKAIEDFAKNKNKE